jgi:plasmid stability protein
MAVLHVRDIPDAFYRRMQKIAKGHGRSLSAEVVALFAGAVRADDVRRRQAELLKSIRQNRWTPLPGTPDAVEMLHQVRAEREAELTRLPDR